MPSDVGTQVSLVVHSQDGWTHMLGTGTQVSCDHAFASGSLSALHCWRLDSLDDNCATLTRLDSSQVVQVPELVAGDFYRFSEVCSGLGGTSSGAILSGLSPCAAMDRSPLACDMLRVNRHPCVISGDVTVLADVGRFHAAYTASRSGLLSGFPCQPFSTLGRQAAFQDSRSQAFFGVLDVAFLTQAVFVLLECVVGAGTHKLVQEALNDFCAARGFVWKPVVLHLNRELPCYRTRWWCLIVPSWLSNLDLVDLPLSDAFPMVASVFPSWPQWPREEEEQLVLTAEERAAFGNPAYCTSDRLLDLQGVCPPLLHSMGSQLYDCPCGCRGPLSHHSLASQGLHGALVVSQWPELGLRHLHPKEASLLLGLPVEYELG